MRFNFLKISSIKHNFANRICITNIIIHLLQDMLRINQRINIIYVELKLLAT